MQFSYTFCRIVVAKVVIRGKFIVVNACFKKEEISQINSHTFHLKTLVKGGQTKPRVSRRKEIVKIRVEINEQQIEKQGFPGGAVVESLPANAGGHGFEPWSGKIPHAAEQLGP